MNGDTDINNYPYNELYYHQFGIIGIKQCLGYFVFTNNINISEGRAEGQLIK